MVKKVSVMEEDWDYLIILDACRYDYFSKLYPPYLCGELRKVISPGSSTIEWCKDSFQEKYNDVVYISANPFINSKVEVLNFNAKDHFYKVIDVWDWGWDEKLGTVHPKTVNEAVQSFKDDYPDKKFIIHYLQPHEPYIGHTSGFSKPSPDTWPFLSVFTTFGTMRIPYLNGILVYIFQRISKILESRCKFNGNPLWRIRPMNDVINKFGAKGLREAYSKNITIVLSYVRKLVKNLRGCVIVTSDHGELLGERNQLYGHVTGVTDPILIEVPWFKVEKSS